jgi:acyl-CoA synthetase (AMP-forming)/AMP-acid ligase II
MFTAGTTGFPGRALINAFGGTETSSTIAALRAIVRLKKGETTTEAEIIDFCRPRLAGYKRPSSVILVKEELPKTSTGKVLRRVLREKYA